MQHVMQLTKLHTSGMGRDMEQSYNCSMRYVIRTDYQTTRT
mgnify:CR=1 FL=1